jgi:tape measure domain-containing protein
MGTERIRVVVTQEGAKAVRGDIEGMAAGADRASKGLSLASSALKGLAAVALGKAVQETIKLADAYTDLTNKIRFATRGEQELTSVRAELFKSANANRASIVDTADLYGKLRLSTQALGLSQREVIELTDTLQKATTLSGASAENAANALRQLGQGMASGALRGDELNSILENTPYIAQVIAESLGKDIGAIRKMGAEGKITGKVISDAFKGARAAIVDEFGKRVPKVSESFTVMGNVLTRLVGEIDDATGASSGLAGMIIRMATALDDAVPEIAALAKNLSDLSGYEGIWGKVLPKEDDQGVSTLQFMALMVSTLEDRVLGAISALKKLALVTAGAGTGLGGIGDDLKTVLTGKGAVTERVLDTIAEFRGGRRGTTTVNEDEKDPRNTLGKKGTNTTSGAAGDAKGKSLREIIAGLEQENRLLQLGDDERKVAEGLIQAQAEAQKKLTLAQMGIVEGQLRRNNAIGVELRLLDEVEARIDRQLEQEIELMDAENARMAEKGIRESEKAQEREENAAKERQLAEDRTFDGAMNVMGDEYLSNMRTFGQEMAAIFGPGGTLEHGIRGVVDSLGDAIGYSIAFGDSWNDTAQAIENIGRSIVAEIISALIRIPIQLALNEVIASGLRAKAAGESVGYGAAVTGASVAEAGVLSAAWSTPAALASAATFGASAVAGAASLATSVAAARVLSTTSAIGFAGGGYTGSGSRRSVAGLVHGQEYVVNAAATARHRGQLEAMNAGRGDGAGAQMHVSIINQASGVEFEARQLDAQHMEIIARRAVQEHAPGVIAEDMRSPQGRTGRALAQTTTAKRVRA